MTLKTLTQDSLGHFPPIYPPTPTPPHPYPFSSLCIGKLNSNIQIKSQLFSYYFCHSFHRLPYGCFPSIPLSVRNETSTTSWVTLLIWMILKTTYSMLISVIFIIFVNVTPASGVLGMSYVHSNFFWIVRHLCTKFGCVWTIQTHIHTFLFIRLCSDSWSKAFVMCSLL